MKKFEDLTLADDFLFGQVMSDVTLVRELLARIFPNKNMDQLEMQVIPQFTIDKGYDSHGIRIDVFAQDKRNLYAIEMQVVHRKEDLLKRCRYYQDLMDLYHLKQGMKYRDLKDIYIIFICNFDPFNDKLYMYTANRFIRENGEEFQDGTTYVFLNTTGKYGSIQDSLINVLLYFNDKSITDSYVKQLDDMVQKLKQKEETREKYMMFELKLEDERYYAEKRGIKLAQQKSIHQMYQYFSNEKMPEKQIISTIAQILEIPKSTVEKTLKEKNQE